MPGLVVLSVKQSEYSISLWTYQILWCYSVGALSSDYSYVQGNLHAWATYLLACGLVLLHFGQSEYSWAQRFVRPLQQDSFVSRTMANPYNNEVLKSADSEPLWLHNSVLYAVVPTGGE